MQESSSKNVTTIIVAALGYFVDIYDLILFSIVRISSLVTLGVTDDAYSNLFNLQKS